MYLFGFDFIHFVFSGLFHNVISESGSGLHFWAVNQDPRKQALRFLKQLGCPADNKTEMVRCLKSANAYDIAEIHREVLVGAYKNLTALISKFCAQY